MNNTDHLREMVRESFSNHQAVAQYTRRVENGLRNCEKEIIARYFPPQGHILVVGCGAGREAFALETLGYQVTGTDISQALLNQAQQIAAERKSNIQFHLGNGSTLNFPTETFHAVTLWSQVLGNVPSKQNRIALLGECFNVLKPGGTLSFSVHDLERTYPLLDKNNIVPIDQGDTLEDGDFIYKDENGAPQYWHYFTKPEIEHLCQETHFQNLHIYHTSDLGQTYDNVYITACIKPIE